MCHIGLCVFINQYIYYVITHTIYSSVIYVISKYALFIMRNKCYILYIVILFNIIINNIHRPLCEPLFYVFDNISIKIHFQFNLLFRLFSIPKLL